MVPGEIVNELIIWLTISPGTIELAEMVEIIGTLYGMEGVNPESAGNIHRYIDW